MGGNRFKDTCSPIQKAQIKPTLQEYTKELKRLFPNNTNLFDNIITLGSVYKKEVSGDIDLGIDIPTSTIPILLDDMNVTEQDYNYRWDKYKKRSKTATDEQITSKTLLFFISHYINKNSDLIVCDEKVVPGNMFTEFPQYDTQWNGCNENVQIDWMMGNLEWLKFSYYSSSLSGNLKGLHRTQLIVAMLANKGYVFNHNTGVKNKETNEVVCTTPKEILKLLQTEYTSDITEEVLYDFNKLQTVLYDELMRFDYDDVIDTYLKILDSTRCDVPDVLQQYWIDNQQRLDLKGKFLPETSKLLKLV